MVGTIVNNGMLFGSFNSLALAGRGISPVGVPMLSPKMLGQFEAQDAAAHAPRLINYGSSYALAAKASQINGRDVNGISNPFARFNVPIGDAAFKGESVGMPAVSNVEFIADPDVLNVHPMFDPLVGAEKMIDPEQQGQAEGMWMINSLYSLYIISLMWTGVALVWAGIAVYNLISNHQLKRELNRLFPPESGANQELDKVKEARSLNDAFNKEVV